MFIAGVNNTADMLFTGINDIGGNISPVSLTPVIKPCSGSYSLIP
jgi:hypothetical protein